MLSDVTAIWIRAEHRSGNEIVDLDRVRVLLRCPGDLTGDRVIDTNDFFLYLGLYQVGESRADFFPVGAPDGLINTNDFFAFLAAYHAGC